MVMIEPKAARRGAGARAPATRNCATVAKPPPAAEKALQSTLSMVVESLTRYKRTQREYTMGDEQQVLAANAAFKTRSPTRKQAMPRCGTARAVDGIPGLEVMRARAVLARRGIPAAGLPAIPARRSRPRARRRAFVVCASNPGASYATNVLRERGRRGRIVTITPAAAPAAPERRRKSRTRGRDVTAAVPPLRGIRSTSRWGVPARRRRAGYFTVGIPLRPLAPAAVHRDDVGVPHPLQVLGGERGAESPAAIEDDSGGGVGDGALDIALDDALGQVPRPRQMAARELALLARIDQLEALALVEHGLDVIDRHFTNARLRILDDLQKGGAVS